jgi:adenylate cyclase, class 2
MVNCLALVDSVFQMEVGGAGTEMNGVEREVKIRISSLAGILDRFRSIGARLIQDRTFEDNLVMDFGDLRLKREGMLIRLRQYGDEHILTFKGPATVQGKVKSRTEIEIGLQSSEDMMRILAELGLKVMFRYQKYRTIFQCWESILDSPPDEAVKAEEQMLHLMVDETPIGLFLELEGSEYLIRKTADRLGFKQDDFIPLSYRDLYLEFCLQRDQPFGDMVFYNHS